jgi:hypothetical protein
MMPFRILAPRALKADGSFMNSMTYLSEVLQSSKPTTSLKVEDCFLHYPIFLLKKPPSNKYDQAKVMAAEIKTT